MQDYKTISQYNEEQLGKDRKSRMYQVAMYADTAHFVYELLQNADDAGASEISFNLTQESLVVEHNGKPFDDTDVKAISYFGKGKTEVTAIGRFGLGFKSVFAYTASPRIHSADDNFELVDLYTLRGIKRPINLAEEQTRFVLPFDHLEKEPVYVEPCKFKSPEKAWEEISTKLRNLGGTTLLFTKALRVIQWSDGENHGQYLREDTPVPGSGRETLLISENAADQYFLVYPRPVYWPDKKGEMAEHRPVAIAVELDKSHTDGGLASGNKNHKLWVFFPTDKETHTGFIIQGPFRTTPARDNVPWHDEFNQHLVSETASLLRVALNAMRDIGLVNTELLSRLPLDKERFETGSFLRPLYDSVRTALKEDPLLPTNKGKHVPATRGKLARDQKLTELLNSKQLSHLCGQSGLEWLEPTIAADGYRTLHHYLVGFKQYSWRDVWDVEPLVKNMEVRVEDIARKISAEFMTKQTNTWLANLYRFLEKGRGYYAHFRRKPLIRLESGKHVLPFDDKGTPNAYLPTDTSSDFPTVKRYLARLKGVREFLQKTVGLTVPNIVDEIIKTVLPRYENPIGLKVTTWKRDFKKIMAVLEGQDSDKRSQLEEKLRSIKWVLVRPLNEDNSFHLVSPNEAYVFSDELRAYFKHSKTTFLLAKGYYTDKQIEVLLKLGLARLPRVEKRESNYNGHVTIVYRHGWHQRGLNGFDLFWHIDGLETALSKPSVTNVRGIMARRRVVNRR